MAVLASANRRREEFDARRDARSRTYCYRLLARRTRSVFERDRAYWWTGPLDREAARRPAPSALAGRHDFTAFTPSETEHKWFRCTVARAEWRDDGELLEFWIEADMFLRHMNRVLVGTMLDVARGWMRVRAVRRAAGGAPALAGRARPRRRTGWRWRAVSY